MNLFIKQKETHKPGEWFAKGKDGGRDSWGVWDVYVHITMFKMNSQQGPTVEHMELCSMLCGSPDKPR